jgi:predicted membrane GTPase involved in stress response
MIVGENARPEDLPVNPSKAKHSPTCAAKAKAKAFSWRLR